MSTVSPHLAPANLNREFDFCFADEYREVSLLVIALDAVLIACGEPARTTCPVPTPPDVSGALVCAGCGSFVRWLA